MNKFERRLYLLHIEKKDEERAQKNLIYQKLGKSKGLFEFNPCRGSIVEEESFNLANSHKSISQI
jgi:hypothetical protein